MTNLLRERCSPLKYKTTKWLPSHLCLSLDGVHLADELTVCLEEQQQLKVQFIESAAQFQLLRRHRHSHKAALRSGPLMMMVIRQIWVSCVRDMGVDEKVKMSKMPSGLGQR